MSSNTNKQFSQIMSSAESSYHGRVHTPWVPIRSGKTYHLNAPIDSVSVGHTIVVVDSQNDKQATHGEQDDNETDVL